MAPAAPVPPHWSTEPPGPWYRWRGYMVRWLLFGLVVSVFQPVADNASPIWLDKVYQALVGLIFGAACAVVFTLAENRFNTPRVNWKSWLIVLGTWLLVKVSFVSVIAMTG
ncbi:hypothetical protein [Rhodoferax sp.]|uniref:hypothetical protein n=1 Tax=Rhodoferax sp. TaxID=50421 RepID=UPI0028402533|nr:hypothetical protein [Rhodoferax sp.]MDR3370859.1 hypothetical protein [Rhodoferax sp.]